MSIVNSVLVHTRLWAANARSVALRRGERLADWTVCLYQVTAQHVYDAFSRIYSIKGMLASSKRDTGTRF